METLLENITEEPQGNAPANVVRLSEYRKRRQAVQPTRSQDWGPQYYCLRCDGDEFKLYASGIVHCAHCGSLMRNLLVSGAKSEEPAQ